MRQQLLVYLGVAALIAIALLSSQAPFAALVASAVLVGLSVVLRDIPRAGLYTVLVFVPIDTLGYIGFVGPVFLTVTKVAFPPALLALVLTHVMRRRPFVSCRQNWAVAAFAGAILLATVINGFHPRTADELVLYVSAILLYFLAINVIRTARDVRTVLILITCSCVFAVTLGLFEAMSGIRIFGIRAWGGDVARFSGYLNANPNTFATNMLVPLFVCLYFMAITRKRWLKPLLAVVSVVLSVSVIQSYSRAVMIVVAISTLHLLYRLKRHVKVSRMLLVGTGLLLCIVPLIPATWYARMQSLVSNTQIDPSLLNRLSYNIIGTNIFLRHPLWGAGPGAFLAEYTSTEWRFVAANFEGTRVLHNMYLSVACHMGLIGVIAFGAIIVYCLADLRQIIRTPGPDGEGRVLDPRPDEQTFLVNAATAIEVAFVAFLLSSIFLPNEHQKYMWTLFAMIPVMARLHRSDLTGEPHANAAPHTSS